MDIPYAGDLTPEEAWQLLAARPEAVLVDVRTPAEWAAVGVPALEGRDVVLLPWVTAPGLVNPSFLEELEALGLAPGTPLVLLCRSGHRSAAAASALTAAGLGPAFNVAEGYEGWVASGLPWSRPED